MVHHRHIADVDVRDVDHVDVGHGTVVEERSSAPLATDEADTTIAEAVVDASVEADVRSPVTGMKQVNATLPAPVCGCPKNADGWRLHPDTRNPVVAVRTVGP